MTFKEWYEKYFQSPLTPVAMWGHGEQFKSCWNAAIKAASDYVGHHPYGGMENLADDLWKDLTS